MRLSNSEKLKKDRVQDALATNTQLIEYETKLDSLFKKRDALEKSMPGLSAAIKTAEHEKHIVIDNYCDDKCTSEDLETAKKSYDEAVNIEKRTVELLKVVNTKIANLNARLQDLREKKLKTKQLVWESLSDEANEDLQKKLGDMILWAYTVNRQRQRPLSYDDFLQMVVFPNPGAEDMKRFGPELGALYQKTLNE
jgi:hypothetical protein